MNSRKRFYILASVPIALLLIYLLLPRGSWSEKLGNQPKYEKIRTGMTMIEVERVFGFLAGSYTTKPYLGRFSVQVMKVGDGGSNTLNIYSWNFDDGTAEVDFVRGKVTDKKWHDREESPLHHIRDFLEKIGL